MFDTFIVQPLFNFLTFIYAILPGHNFGLAIIIFTIVIRVLMWPLIKKQLHNARIMRQIQPELKRIKKDAAGDRQKESMMVMELYKAKGVGPFSSIGIMLVQLPILFGLFAGLRKIIDDPNAVVDFSYPFVQDLSWMQTLAADISKFDATLFGFIDLKQAALNSWGVYWPAMLLVIGSAVVQFYSSRQLMPTDKNARKLRQILREAGKGGEADQAEVNAAVSRSTQYFIPVLIFFFTVNIASALSLYWLVGGLFGMMQQARVLKDEEVDIETKLHKDEPKSKSKTAKEKPSPKTTSSNRKKVKSKARVVSITTAGKKEKK